MSGVRLVKEPYRKEFAEEKDLFKPLIRLPTQKLVKFKEQIEEGKKIKAGTGFCYGSLWKATKFSGKQHDDIAVFMIYKPSTTGKDDKTMDECGMADRWNADVRNEIEKLKSGRSQIYSSPYIVKLRSINSIVVNVKDNTQREYYMLELVYDVFGNFTNASLEQAKTKSSSSEYTFETPINNQVLGSGICKGKFWKCKKTALSGNTSEESEVALLCIFYAPSCDCRFEDLPCGKWNAAASKWLDQIKRGKKIINKVNMPSLGGYHGMFRSRIEHPNPKQMLASFHDYDRPSKPEYFFVEFSLNPDRRITGPKISVGNEVSRSRSVILQSSSPQNVRRAEGTRSSNSIELTQLQRAHTAHTSALMPPAAMPSDKRSHQLR